MHLCVLVVNDIQKMYHNAQVIVISLHIISLYDIRTWKIFRFPVAESVQLQHSAEFPMKFLYYEGNLKEILPYTIVLPLQEF